MCITLRDAHDRHGPVRATFESLGIADMVTYYVAERSPHGGTRGCFESHVAVMEACLGAPGCETVLIFEDDFVPTPSYSEETVRDAVSFMRSHPSWHSVSLGYSIFDGFEHYARDVAAFVTADMPAPHVARFYGRMTQAYAVSRSGMAVLVEWGRRILTDAEVAGTPGKVIPYDEFTVQALRHAPDAQGYSVVPMMFDQRWCAYKTSIGHSYHDTGMTTSSAVTAHERAFREHQCWLERTRLFYVCSLLREHRVLALLVLAALVSLIVLALWLLVGLVTRTLVRVIVPHVPTLGLAWGTGLLAILTASAGLGVASATATATAAGAAGAARFADTTLAGIALVRTAHFAVMLFASLYVLVFAPSRKGDLAFLVFINAVMAMWFVCRSECLLSWADERLMDPAYVAGTGVKRVTFVRHLCGDACATLVTEYLNVVLAAFCLFVVATRHLKSAWARAAQLAFVVAAYLFAYA